MKHRTRNISLALTLTIAQHQALATDTQQLLADLAAKINEARSLPAGAKPSFRCPGELEGLVGTPIATINTTIPKADLTLGDSQVYFLTGPRPRGQRGGGFPEITFFFDKAAKVERITCTYAR